MQNTLLRVFALSLAGTMFVPAAVATDIPVGYVSYDITATNIAQFDIAGSGTPDFVDYVQAYLPNTPDGRPFSAGYDPHTITAYTSPNNGKAYGLMADWYGGVNWVAVIDLQALMSASRTTGTHSVAPAVNLLTSGIVRYVATH